MKAVMEGGGRGDNPVVSNIIVQNRQAYKSDSSYEIYTFLWDVVLDVDLFLCPLEFCSLQINNFLPVVYI